MIICNLKKLFKLLRFILLVVILVRIFLMFFLKDSIWPISGFYYVLPFKLLIILLALFFFISLITKSLRIFSVVIILFLGSIFITEETGFINSNQNIDLILWNVAREKTSSKNIADFVESYPAKNYVFIEYDANEDSNKNKGKIPSLIKDYHLFKIPGNISILSKYNNFSIVDSILAYDKFWVVTINHINYLIVDIGSWPFYNRSKSFKIINNLLNKYDIDIICGDFNTPFDSIHYKSILVSYKCGIKENKYGRDTWPTFLPFTSIDHIFVANKYVIENYSIINITLTDHFPLQISLH